VTLPATVLSGVLVACLIEAWVRLTWDPHMGTPGLFISDPVRGQRLAPGYTGWFAGVPVRINNLGLRDDHDATLDKRRNTFRVLVLGDSVTFGHGSVHTYPALLEELLKRWRPDVDFQVWNAAVPGYNTSQELAQLLEQGPAFRPDLVIVGFFENDLIDNRPVEMPSWFARASSNVIAFVQRHVYSVQLYKRVYLTLAWRLSRSTGHARRLEHLETESALLAGREPVHERAEQKLTDYDRLPAAALAGRLCIGGERPDPTTLAQMQREPGWVRWVEAVRGFQSLHQEGLYRVVFFLNTVPPACFESSGEYFYEGGSRAVNDLYLSVMRGPTPAVSAFDAFLRRVPSQMPAARGHAIGNSNMTKAEVLFEFLRDEILPPMVGQPPFNGASVSGR
jgi:hypothetical protein